MSDIFSSSCARKWQHVGSSESKTYLLLIVLWIVVLQLYYSSWRSDTRQDRVLWIINLNDCNELTVINKYHSTTTTPIRCFLFTEEWPDDICFDLWDKRTEFLLFACQILYHFWKVFGIFAENLICWTLYKWSIQSSQCKAGKYFLLDLMQNKYWFISVKSTRGCQLKWFKS